MDTDGDGYLDSVDACPLEPEDFDNFEDDEGCPDPDNDKDKVCDPWVSEKQQSGAYTEQCVGVDACPMDPEDIDQFEDENGCPDPDNDQDGILDVNDECPLDPEDKDEFEDENGCPDPDNDQDGIPDNQDECFDLKEDGKGKGRETKDGCPIDA